MMNSVERRGSGIGAAVLGVSLVVLGGLALIDQLFGFDLHIGWLFWPFTILVPGALLLLAAATVDSGSEPLAIVGSIISMVGLVLLFQNTTGLWATWAYAWALVAPTGPGLGLMYYGLLRNAPEKVRDGKRVVKVGLVIFLVGAIFFELIIGVSGFGLGHYLWPLLLVGLGLLLLVKAFLPSRAS